MIFAAERGGSIEAATTQIEDAPPGAGVLQPDVKFNPAAGYST